MKNQSAKISNARENDYSACLRLFAILYHGDLGPDFKQTFEDFVNNKNGTILLAERSSKVIGILVGSYHLDIDWEGRIAEIDALIVDKTSRRKGIGKELVRYFINIARKEHCKAVKSRVNRKNVGAHQFHETLGFARADTYEYFLDFQEQ